MDFSAQGNGRLAEEENGKIRPEESLALRVLYLFCREVGQSFEGFITQLINTNTDELELVARVLAQLELRDVIQAACSAFQVTVYSRIGVPALRWSRDGQGYSMCTICYKSSAPGIQAVWSHMCNMHIHLTHHTVPQAVCSLTSSNT
jgi:hypothetical protein